MTKHTFTIELPDGHWDTLRYWRKTGRGINAHDSLFVCDNIAALIADQLPEPVREPQVGDLIVVNANFDGGRCTGAVGRIVEYNFFYRVKPLYGPSPGSTDGNFHLIEGEFEVIEEGN